MVLGVFSPWVSPWGAAVPARGGSPFWVLSLQPRVQDMVSHPLFTSLSLSILSSSGFLPLTSLPSAQGLGSLPPSHARQ